MKITRKQLRHLILQETRHALRDQGLAWRRARSQTLG